MDFPTALFVIVGSLVFAFLVIRNSSNVQIHTVTGSGNTSTFITKNGRVVSGFGERAPIGKRTIALTPFSELKASLPFEIVVEKSDCWEVEFQAEERILNQLTALQSGSLLTVGASGSFQTSQAALVTIRCCEVPGTIMQFGSGDLKVKSLKTAHASMKLAGSGNFSVSGSADFATVTLSGSGNLNAKDLLVDRLRVELSGSGNIRATAAFSADASLSGSGDIRISGKPRVREAKKMGSGSIEFV